MVDGSCFKLLDDGVIALHDAHKQSHVPHDELISDVNLVATSLEDQKKVLNKVLVQPVCYSA